MVQTCRKHAPAGYRIIERPHTQRIEIPRKRVYPWTLLSDTIRPKRVRDGYQMCSDDTVSDFRLGGTSKVCRGPVRICTSSFQAMSKVPDYGHFGCVTGSVARAFRQTSPWSGSKRCHQGCNCIQSPSPLLYHLCPGNSKIGRHPLAGLLFRGRDFGLYEIV